MSAAKHIRAFGDILPLAELAAGDLVELQGACIRYEEGTETRMTSFVRLMYVPDKTGHRGSLAVRGWLVSERRWGEHTRDIPEGARGRLVSKAHAKEAWKLPLGDEP